MKRVVTAIIIAIVAAIIILTGLDNTGYDERFEAESLFWNNYVETEDDNGASGGKYVRGLLADGDQATLLASIPETGYYDIIICGRGINDYQNNILYIDGSAAATITLEPTKEFSAAELKRQYLSSGSHEFSLVKDYGFIELDYIEISESDINTVDYGSVSGQLSDTGADECVIRLYRFLCGIYGRYTLSGQYTMMGVDSPEMTAIREVTGKQPAVLMQDMRNGVFESSWYPDPIPNAVEYHEMGGINSLCWHWYLDEKYTTGGSERNVYSEYANIDLIGAMLGTDAEAREYIEGDIRLAAEKLKILSDAGIPVLWRPLHEASGGWFWWSKDGADAYKLLWRLMYSIFTEEYGLHNLIWVYSDISADWYPGDEYVDIVGVDVYEGAKITQVNADSFIKAVNLSGGTKPVAITECGPLPDIDEMKNSNTMWLGCCVWHEEYVVDESGNYSEEYNTRDNIRKFYNDSSVLTLDELQGMY